MAVDAAELRMVEDHIAQGTRQRVTLVTRMAEDAREAARIAAAELYESRAEEYTRYARVLRHGAVASLRDSKRSPEEG